MKLELNNNQHLKSIQEDVEMISFIYASQSLTTFQILPEESNRRFPNRLNGIMIITENDIHELFPGHSFHPVELTSSWETNE